MKKEIKDYDEREGSGVAVACAILFVIACIVAVSSIGVITLIRMML